MSDRSEPARSGLGKGLGELAKTLTSVTGAAGTAAAVVSGVLIPTLKNTGYQREEVYQLKTRRDVRLQRFELVLSGNTSIRVPFATAGNLGGLHDQLAGDDRHFRVVNLDDPTFDRQTVVFAVDPAYAPAFGEFVNAASVTLVKDYGEDEREYAVVFRPDSSGTDLVHEVSYPLLGQTGADRRDFRYLVQWSLRGGTAPAAPPQWTDGDGQLYVSLAPPFRRIAVQVEVDRERLAASGVRHAVVELGAELNGRRGLQRRLHVSPTSDGAPVQAALYHDPGTDVVYRVVWVTDEGETRTAPAVLHMGAFDDVARLDITAAIPAPSQN